MKRTFPIKTQSPGKMKVPLWRKKIPDPPPTLLCTILPEFDSYWHLYLMPHHVPNTTRAGVRRKESSPNQWTASVGFMFNIQRFPLLGASARPPVVASLDEYSHEPTPPPPMPPPWNRDYYSFFFSPARAESAIPQKREGGLHGLASDLQCLPIALSSWGFRGAECRTDRGG